MENKPAYQHDSIIVFIININADHSWFEMTRKILVEGGTNRNLKMITNFPLWLWLKMSPDFKLKHVIVPHFNECSLFNQFMSVMIIRERKKYLREIKKMPNQPTYHSLIMCMLYLGIEVAPCYKLLYTA